MNGRRAAVGLSLLCALAFCAFVAPSAQAIVGTTAVTCEPVEPPTGTGFSDEHCNNAVTTGASWRHGPLGAEKPTAIEGTNEKTASATAASTTAVLEGEAGGLKTKIECKIVASTGTLANEVNAEGAGKPENGLMTVSGTATINYTKCTAPEPLKGTCTVTEPIVAEATAMSKSENGEMWVEFKGAKAGGVFTEITLGVCAVKGTYKVTGTAIGTPKGATLEFIKGEPKSTLEFAAKAATFSSIETLRMKEPKGGPRQNPISLTTE